MVINYNKYNIDMYCRKCGKQIADDSSFCSFCGTEVYPIGKEDVKHLTLLDRFKAMSKGYQVFVILWIFDILIFWCIAAMHSKNGEHWGSLIIFGLIIPYVILCTRYLYRLFRMH